MRFLLACSTALALVGACNQEETLPHACPSATSAPLTGTDVSAYAGITPDALLARLDATHTGVLASVDPDDAVFVSMPVTVTHRVVSAGTLEDVAANAPAVLNPNATEFCPAGDHLRIVDVHLVMDVVPADGSDPFIVEVPDVEIRAYGTDDADIEMFAYGDYRITLPPVLQAAADANACGPAPVGRAGISNLLTDPAPLFGFDIGLVADQCSGAFLTFTPDP